MTNSTLHILKGNWYDEDGYLAEQGARFPVFVHQGAVVDDLGISYRPNSEGNLSHGDGLPYFSPDSGELARIGLA
jgi:hypothetical protein